MTQFFHMTWPSKKLSDKFIASIQNPCTPYTILSPSYFRTVSMPYTCIPRLHVGISNSESDSWSRSTPPPNHCQQWTGIRNLQILDSKIDNWRHCLQAIVPCPLDRLWGHWWRNFLDPHFWTRTCSEIIADFHSAYPAKSGPLSSLWLRQHFTSIESYCSFPNFTKRKSILFTILLLIVESSTSSLPAPEPLFNPWESSSNAHLLP